VNLLTENQRSAITTQAEAVVQFKQ